MGYARVPLGGDGDASHTDAALYRRRQLDGRSDYGKETYDDAVGARHGRAAALAARAYTDDADRAAGQAQQDVEVAQVNTQETEESLAGLGASLIILNVSITLQFR